MNYTGTSLRVIKAIRHQNRRAQGPTEDSVADPRTYDLDPACPVRSAHGYEISLLSRVVAANALCEQCRYPGRSEHEDYVEERVVVLCPVLLVIVLGSWRVVFIVTVIERGRRQRAGFDSAPQCFLTHLSSTLRLLIYEPMATSVFCVKCDVALT